MFRISPVDAVSFERSMVEAFVRAEDNELERVCHVTLNGSLLHDDLVRIRLHPRLHRTSIQYINKVMDRPRSRDAAAAAETVALLKAKFHYATCFEAGSMLVADRFEAGRRPASKLRTSFEPASVMEFGF